MKLTLHIWKQENSQTQGGFVSYKLDKLSPDLSFLEMLDILNESLIKNKKEPVAFDHDCREGICGSCSLKINGKSHGPSRGQASCQIHLRQFKDGDEIWIEPFRAKSFPVIRDLIVDRSAFDRIVQAGGYISVKTGSAPKPTVFLCKNQKQIQLSLQRPASAAEPVWTPAKTPQPAFLSELNLCIFPLFPREEQKIKHERLIWFNKWTKKALDPALIQENAKPFAPKKFLLKQLHK